MDDRFAPRPLGSYRQFGPSKPQAWGGRSGWSVTFGAGVIPDLIAGIREHAHIATRNYPGKFWPATAAIGCVPFLTSTAVADALLELSSCCVVVDKQANKSAAIARLAAREDGGLSSHYLHEMHGMTVPGIGGSGPVVGPTSPWPDPVELGPIRVAGSHKDRTGRLLPMLHAKVLLLGVTTIGEGELGQEIPEFAPKRAWLGSANWTTLAPHHLEYGIWCDDADLLDHTRAFLIDVLRFSEQRGSTAAGPEPQLVDIEFDDEAFVSYLAEYGPWPDDEET